jgi:hypothetical protein
MFKFAESSFAIFMQYVKVIDNLHKYLSKLREFPIPGHNSGDTILNANQKMQRIKW